jgi:hypothetical protein
MLVRSQNLMETRDARSVAISFSGVDALCRQWRDDLRNLAGKILASIKQAVI